MWKMKESNEGNKRNQKKKWEQNNVKILMAFFQFCRRGRQNPLKLMKLKTGRKLVANRLDVTSKKFKAEKNIQTG